MGGLILHESFKPSIMADDMAKSQKYLLLMYKEEPGMTKFPFQYGDVIDTSQTIPNLGNVLDQTLNETAKKH